MQIYEVASDRQSAKNKGEWDKTHKESSNFLRSIRGHRNPDKLKSNEVIVPLPRRE